MNLEVFTRGKSVGEYVIGFILFVIDCIFEALVGLVSISCSLWTWAQPHIIKSWRSFRAWLREDPKHLWFLLLFGPSLYFGLGFLRCILILGLGAHALPLPSVDWWWIWLVS